MRKHLPLLLLITMLLPLAALALLAERLADREQDAAAMRMGRLLGAQLDSLATPIHQRMQQFERQLQSELDSLPANWSLAAQQLRDGAASEPRFFVLDPAGRLVYPTSYSTPASAEQMFLASIQRIWGHSANIEPPATERPVSGAQSETREYADPPAPALKMVDPVPLTQEREVNRRALTEPTDLAALGEESEATSSSEPGASDDLSVTNDSRISRPNPAPQSVPAPASDRMQLPESGWEANYIDHSLQLLRWRRLADGGLIGVELDRIDLLLELIALLPADDGSLPDARIRLRNAQGEILYQWGRFSPSDDQPADAQRALDAPLHSWRLEYLLNPAQAGNQLALQRLEFQLLLGMGMLLVGLLALVVHRETRRALDEASQRVNFVNQVSHELKTPLTNIRLYAELLQQDLEDDPALLNRLRIIIAETGRLSRLIGNVLTLARGRRKQLQLHPRSVDADGLIRDLLEQFRPSLERLRIETRLDLAAGDPIQADPDALSQILGNLINNLEKYAASGGLLALSSRLENNRLVIELEDAGPGIPRRQRRKVFQPFVRLRSDLTEGVSGTGIGLSIARQLAELHGGRLQLLDSEPGCRFRLELPITGPKT